ncbi:MAG: hypothetical protein ABH864_03565 [archaeon]
MAKKKKRLDKKAKDLEESKGFAWVASFFLIVGFVIALVVRRNDKYVMYYAKQGLVLFFGFIIGGVVDFIPIVGNLFVVFVVVLWVISWVNALSGEKRRTWIVQDIAEKIKI